MFQDILKYATIFIFFGTLIIEEEILQWIKIILHDMWSIFLIFNLTLSLLSYIYDIHTEVSFILVSA